MINLQDKILQKTECMIYFHIMFPFFVTFFFDISVNGWGMYKSKVNDMNNIAGAAIRNLRIAKGWSQRELADALQLLGLDLDKNAIQRIEARKRFVTDIELTYFAKVFNVDYQELLKMPIE